VDERVGHTSEATISLAFERAVGLTPGRRRREATARA
jgi:transcriptional regulator GlxA family with amidase domain